MNVMKLISDWVTPKQRTLNPIEYLLSEQYPKDLAMFIAIMIGVLIGVNLRGLI